MHFYGKVRSIWARRSHWTSFMVTVSS